MPVPSLSTTAVRANHTLERRCQACQIPNFVVPEHEDPDVIVNLPQPDHMWVVFNFVLCLRPFLIYFRLSSEATLTLREFKLAVCD